MIPIINRVALKSPRPGRLRQFYETLGMQFISKKVECVAKLTNDVELSISNEPYSEKIYEYCRMALVVDDVEKRTDGLRQENIGEILKVNHQEEIGTCTKVRDPDGNIILLTDIGMSPAIKQLTWIPGFIPGHLRRFFEELGIPFLTRNDHFVTKLPNGIQFSIATMPSGNKISDHCRLGLKVGNITKCVSELRDAEVGEILKAAYQRFMGPYAKIKTPDGHIIVLTEGR